MDVLQISYPQYIMAAMILLFPVMLAADLLRNLYKNCLLHIDDDPDKWNFCEFPCVTAVAMYLNEVISAVLGLSSLIAFIVCSVAYAIATGDRNTPERIVKAQEMMDFITHLFLFVNISLFAFITTLSVLRTKRRTQKLHARIKDLDEQK